MNNKLSKPSRKAIEMVEAHMMLKDHKTVSKAVNEMLENTRFHNSTKMQLNECREELKIMKTRYNDLLKHLKPIKHHIDNAIETAH